MVYVLVRASLYNVKKTTNNSTHFSGSKQNSVRILMVVGKSAQFAHDFAVSI